MLKTYRIIPLVFILFLFGFTFITVAPVLSEDSPEFVACQQIKPSGDFRLMKQKKNCFRDVARLYQVASVNSAVTPSDPSGGEVAELNARIAELEARLGDEVAQLKALIFDTADCFDQPIKIRNSGTGIAAKAITRCATDTYSTGR